MAIGSDQFFSFDLGRERRLDSAVADYGNNFFVSYNPSSIVRLRGLIYAEHYPPMTLCIYPVDHDVDSYSVLIPTRHHDQANRALNLTSGELSTLRNHTQCGVGYTQWKIGIERLGHADPVWIWRVPIPDDQ